MTTPDRTAEDLIEALDLQPIEDEGAWWAPGPRTPGLSSITVLLTAAPDGFSALHRLTVDEGWQWLDGAPARLLLLSPAAEATAGPLTLDAGSPQVVVPAGTWQGAATLGPWTLAACWCSPAFTWEAFTLGERTALQAAYPAWHDDIAGMTRRV